MIVTSSVVERKAISRIVEILVFFKFNPHFFVSMYYLFLKKNLKFFVCTNWMNLNTGALNFFHNNPILMYRKLF